MKKTISIALSLMLILGIGTGCKNQSVPTATSSDRTMVSSNSSTSETAARLINPYETNMTLDEMKSNLDAILNGKKLSELSGNDRFNAELLTFIIAKDSGEAYKSDYYYSDTFKADNAEFFDLGKPALYDLDGDNKEEKITVTDTGDIETSENMTLTINDVSVKFYAMSALKQFAIVDINTSDSRKEIFICEDGPSDDPASYIFEFDSKQNKIISCSQKSDIFPTIPSNLSPEHTGVDIDGSGTIRAFKRAQPLQTWTIIAEYELTNNSKIIEKTPKDGYYLTNYAVFMLKALTCNESMDVSSKAVVIKAGQVAHITATDDNEWIQVTGTDGVKGWAHLTDYDKIQNGTDISITTDIFWGLLFAD